MSLSVPRSVKFSEGGALFGNLGSVGSFKSWGISLGHSPVLAGHIQSRDASRPIAYERKYLMNYKTY